jgi:uncharacterized RDD family membrane protein YckC
MTEQPPGPPPSGFPPPPAGGYPPPPSGGSYPPPFPGGPGYPPPPMPGGYPPPPMPGGYPPPPPGAGGYAPPPPVNAIGQLPQSAYTSWFTRVLASLIDFIPVAVIEGIGFGIMVASSNTTCVRNSSYDYGGDCAMEVSALGVTAVSIAGLLAFAFAIWNYGYRQGTTGSSIGKSVMNFKVVSERTGLPIGFGQSLVRQLAHLVDTIFCYIGYLFPLWDPKRQTLADKIMATVCLPTDS